MSKATRDEKALIELTKNALSEVLGREPSKQEVWRVHAGFKRMAFMLLEHLDHIKKYENQNIDDEDLLQDSQEIESKTFDEERTLGEEGEHSE